MIDAQADTVSTPSRSAARIGELLDRARIIRGAIVLLGLEAAVFVFLIAGTHGWIVPLERPTTTDFVSFYAAGSLADAGTPALAYDHAAHLAAEERATAPGIEYQYFNYPPVFLLLCAVLTKLPYLAAFVVFEALTLGFFVLVAWRIKPNPAALLPLLAFPPLWWNLGLGQNAFLTAALFGAGTLLIDRRPVLAGICFGALVYKPHFGLLLPFALVAGGYWRASVAAGLTAAVLVLASLALLGLDTWRGFLAVAGPSHAMYESGRILFGGFVSPFGGVRLLGGSVALAYGVQAIATLAAAVAVILAWRRHLPLALRAAILISATAVAVPLSLIYDLTLTSLAVWWRCQDDEKPVTAGEMVVLTGLFALSFAAPHGAQSWQVPVLPASALVLFGIVLRHAWRASAAAPVRSPTALLPS